MVKTKTALDQTALNANNQTPYLDIDSEKDTESDAQILKAKAVVIIDPLTGKALGASDFFLAQQPDAVISQANPVSTTLYTVLDTTVNCRIYSIATSVTWGVTQPTPLEVVLTIDGNTIIYSKSNPVTATYYDATTVSEQVEASQFLDTSNAARTRSFLIEGRSVKVQVRVTWAVTQPTPLVCRVKYAKR